MRSDVEEFKITVFITKDDKRITLIGNMPLEGQELCLDRFNPNSSSKFPDNPVKTTSLENCVRYRNGIMIELPDGNNRVINSAGVLEQLPDGEIRWLNEYVSRFDSYPTATATIIDRIEESLDWEIKSNYPLKLNKFRIPRNRRDIPVNILNEGKPVVATYLYVIHGWSRNEVAEMLDLSPETVQQYLTNVRTGTR
jgi:hypothetical protein